MKNLFFVSFIVLASFMVHSQNVVYHENFELPSLADSVASTGTAGSSSWGISTNLFNSGLRSDTCIITTGDTTWLTTSSFSTLGSYVVYLEFAHICKIEFFDAAEIEVSNNNGVSWTKLTDAEYMGSGQFLANGNKFTSTSYSEWQPGNNNAIPTNAWWKNEKFDISSIASNSANVKVRFMLRDANASGSAGNYGWLIDDISVWVPYLQEAAAVSWSLPFSLPSGCGITNEVIRIKIANTGSGIIAGNLSAGFQRTGIPPVTETFTTNINAGDTITYTFNNTINLTPLNNDTTYNIRVWVSLAGDPVQTNDTLTGSVIARIALPDPVINDTTIPYGTSITLQASHTQPVSWYSDILATNLLGVGSTYITPILYDTAVYYVQAGTGAGGTCPSAVKAVTVNISGIPNNDAGVLAVSEPSGLVSPGVGYPVKVIIKNTGVLPLAKVTINYSVNGASRPPYMWTGSLLNDSVYGPITIGTDTFSAGVYRIKAWTTMPNDSIDIANHNDTAESVVYLCLAGTFTLGTPVSDFPDFPTFMSILDSVGLCGDAIINIAPGTYNEQLSFASISGVSDTSRLTLQSASSNPQDVIIKFTASSSANNYVIRLSGTRYLNIRNITIQAAGATYAYAVHLTNGAEHNTFEGNIIQSTYVSNSNSRAVVLYSGTLNQYNTFTGNTIMGGYYGIYCYGASSTSKAVKNVFDGNIIQNVYYYTSYFSYQDSLEVKNNIIMHAAAPTTNYGIYTNYCQNGSTIRNNTITLAGAAVALYGIYTSTCTYGFTIDKNYVSTTSTSTNYGIYASGDDYQLTISNNTIKTNTTSTSYSLYLGSCDGSASSYINVYNNMVSHNGGTTNTVYTLYTATNTYINFYYNSILTNGGSTTAGRALYQTGGSNQNYLNNIFVNINGGYAAYFGTYTAVLTSDYNDFYTTGVNLTYWNGNRADLAAHQTASSKDQNSKSVLPGFISNTDLHVSNILLDGAATPIAGITTDIDGQTRNALTPDIGADEFTLLPDDAGIFAFVEPLAPCPNTVNDVKVELKNFGTDTLFTANLHWSVNGVLKDSTSFNGMLLPGGTTVIQMDTMTFYYGTTYNLSFWTTLPNGVVDLQPSNDSLIKTGLKTALGSSTYSIGVGSGYDYQSFTSAINDLVTFGICGPVIFNVASGTYTEQLQIPQINGASATNTITFQSASGDSSSVILTYAPTSTNNHILWLNGADYITIKHLKFISTGSTYGICIKLNNNATHNSILNNHFLGINPAYGASSPYEAALIYATYGGNSWDSCNVFRNNYLNRGYCGIIDNNPNAIGEHGLEITDNVFIDHSYIATSLYYLSRPVLSGNYVYQSVPTTYTNSTLHGFYNFKCINGAVYKNNKIYVTNISPNNYAITIRETTGTPQNPIEVYNNFISLQAGTGISTCIDLNSLTSGSVLEYANVYYNSTNITGSSASSRCIKIEKGPGTISNVVVKNNIFADSAGGYCIYTDVTSGFTSDHNDLFTTGSYIGYQNVNISTLSNWKIATGQDSMSVSVNPMYFSATDLHTAVFDLNGAAVPISGITTDIDGDTRHPVTPDIGADEFIPTGMDAHLVAVVTPNSGCGLGNETVSIMIRNASSDTINGNMTANYKTLNSSTVISQPVTSTVIPGDTLLFTFTTPVNLSVTNDSTFTLIAWIDLLNDPIQYNDTAHKNIISGVIPNPPVVSDTIIPYASFAVIPAYSPGTVFWYDSLSGGNLFHIGPTYTTPVLYDTVTYYVEAKSGSMQSSPFTIGTGTITNTNTTYPAPYGNYYWGAKHQFLIRATELTASGMVAGTINSIGFDVASVAGSALQGLEIKMGQTSATSLSTWYTGTSLVFFKSTSTPTVGWNMHNFSNSFNWDGSSNIVVQVCFNNTSSSSNCIFRQTSTSYTSTIVYYGNSSGICMTTATPTASFSQRPNIRFLTGANLGYCSSVRVPLTVYVSPPPPNDAGVHSVTNPGSSVVSGIPIPVTVILKNYGSDTLHSAVVNWEVNGVLQTPFAWTGGNVPYNQLSPPIVIGNKIFSGGVYIMKLWTSLPNNYPDTSNLNDTIQVSFTACMGGTFTIGGTSADYPTFTAAVADLVTYGVCGPVVFNVNNGTYTEQVVIPQLQGTSATNTVTFQSAAGDSTSVTLTYSPTSSANHVVWLNGADHIIFKHLKMVSVGTTYGIIIKLSNGATHNSILNNHFVGTNPPTGASSPYNAAIIYASYGNNSYDSCNVYRNNYFYKGYCGVIDNNSSAPGEHGLEITDNIFIDQSYIAASLYYLSRPVITGNKVKLHVPSTYTNNTLHGFYNYWCTNGSVIKNNNVYITSASPHSYGISIRESNGTATNPIEIANNFFSLESTNGTNVGIKFSSLTSGTTVQHARIYYNSINITGTGTATNTTTWAFELEQGAGSISNMIMKNNIFANQMGGYAIRMDMNQGFESDHNDLYTTGTYLGYNMADRATLADWITSTGQDSNSVSAPPGYFSKTDLHTFQIDLNGSAVPIPGYSYDIDGEPRDTITPDIGADEFDPPQYDAGIVSIDKPATPADTGYQDVKVTLRNFGTDTLTTVGIHWQVNGVTQTPYSWTGSLAMGATDDSLTIGQYYFVTGQVNVKAWTTSPNNQMDQFHNNDTAFTSAIVCAGQLNGNYTIGGSNPDFTNFNTALAAISNCGISGPVTFMVAAGTYNEQLVIKEVTNASPANKITFKGATGDSTDVILRFGNQTSSANYVVFLDGADYFVFKNMTIASISGTTYAGVVEIANGANNNEFSHCVIKSSYSTNANARCIYDYTTLNNNNIYRNNHILNGYYGIYISGASTSIFETGTILEGNVVEGYYYYGIYLSYLNDLQVKSNYIDNSNSSAAVYALRLYYCDNMDVSKNNLKVHGSSTLYGMYIYYCDGYAAKPNLVANNFVSLYGTNTATWYGIYIYGCTYLNFVYNSVNQAGGGTSGRALYQTSGSNISLWNNILVNTGNGYAYYIGTPTAIVSTDYNDLYSTGSYLAYWSANITNLTALQAASGKEMHSISADPVFISTSNLHVAGSAVDGQAIPIPLIVADDFDSELRDTITPDIGADEYHPLNYDVGAIAILEPSVSFNAVGSQNDVKVVLLNFGTMPVYNFSMGFQVPGITTVLENYSDTLLPSKADTFLFTNKMVPIAGAFNLKVFTSFGNDQNHQNDTVSKLFTGIPVLALPYEEDFEGSVSYWFRDGATEEWEYGIPSASVINSAHSPSHAWATNLNGNYMNSSTDYLYTPKFNLSIAGPDSLSFWHWVHTESPYDGGTLQYLNVLNNWVTLGSQNDPNATNWYNTFYGGQYRWSGPSSGWILSTYNLSAVTDFGSTTQFRFAFTSNTSNNAYDGWAVDDFKLTIPKIPVDAGVISIVTPSTTTTIGTQVQVEVTIKNFGTDTLTSINVYYKINNNTPVMETWLGTLVPGTVTNYIFNTKYIPPVITSYTFCAYTHDTYTFNDTSCTYITNMLPLYDAGVINIKQPGNYTAWNNNITVKVMIRNMGQNTLTTIPVSYISLNSQTANETWTGSLLPGDSVEYTFVQTYNSTLLVGNYTLCAFTHLSNDTYYQNDTSCKVIQNGVGIEEEYTDRLWLGQNIPNPASGNTFIEYYLPASGLIKFTVMNIVGEVIFESSEKQDQGRHSMELDAGILSSGVYYYSIEFNGMRLVRKMVVN